MCKWINFIIKVIIDLLIENEDKQIRLFNILPLRTNIVGKNICIDTCGLISNFLGVIGFIITLWVFYFFRDPIRSVPFEDLIISPADGVVTYVGESESPIEIDIIPKKKFVKISIFLFLAFILLRKFSAWLAFGNPRAAKFRKSMFECITTAEVMEKVEEFFKNEQLLPFDDNEEFMMGGHG